MEFVSTPFSTIPTAREPLISSTEDKLLSTVFVVCSGTNDRNGCGEFLREDARVGEEEDRRAVSEDQIVFASGAWKGADRTQSIPAVRRMQSFRSRPVAG